MTRAALLASALFAALAPVAVAQSYAVEVTANTLNVREAPMGTRLSTLDAGDRLVVQSARNGWLEIQWEGRLAWISGTYVRRVAATGAQVTVSDLNVRAGPSTTTGILTVIQQGQRYVALSRSNDSEWIKIQLGARVGWVAAFAVTLFDLGNGTTNQPADPNVGVTTHTNQTVSQADLEVLARIIKGEASVCTFEGKVAVGAVVLNRVAAPGFPGTIAGVAHQPWQFSCYNADVRDRLYWGPIPQSCWDAARAAVAGQDPSRGATFYFNPYLVLPSWASTMRFIVRIGQDSSDTHDFYKPR